MAAVDPLQALANDWLAYHRAMQTDQPGLINMPTSDELFQFVIDVDDIIRSDHNKAWHLIQLIFISCQDDFEKACLASGPLEDLLAKHGDLVIDNVEMAASTSEEFRELLFGVWRNGISSSIWQRVKNAAGSAPGENS